MELPPLPIKKKKREADVTPKILAWFRAHPHTCAIEIKATESNTIPRSALLSHQEAALYAAASGTLAHKISDAGHVRNPFDAFILHRVPAYVVAAFTKRGIALVIPIAEWNGANWNTTALYRISL